jgi:ABC-type transporter Mla MlaB component
VSSNDEKYTSLSIPLDKMSDQQIFMLGIIMQEGALRMQEMIVEKLKAEDSACVDWAISVVESVDASTFAPISEEEPEKPAE